MKNKIALLFFCCWITSAFAAETPKGALTVAVYDFTGEASNSGKPLDQDAKRLARKITALVTTALAGETNLVMLERAELQKALKEQAFGISGMVSSGAAARIGALTGAKVLVSGQVIMGEQHHALVVANIIGTETGRLFAVKVAGAENNLDQLSAELSAKIAQTIMKEGVNLVELRKESNAERLERIVQSVTGTNRPSVSLNILYPTGKKSSHSATAEGEFGIILLKAGFPVVDGESERKPDIEIKGVDDVSPGPRRGELFSFHAVIELKIVQRRTGKIIVIDRQDSLATDGSKVGANRAAQARAVDELAARVIPLLAK